MPNKQWHPAFVAAVKETLKDAPPGELVEFRAIEEVLYMAKQKASGDGSCFRVRRFR